MPLSSSRSPLVVPSQNAHVRRVHLGHVTPGTPRPRHTWDTPRPPPRPRHTSDISATTHLGHLGHTSDTPRTQLSPPPPRVFTPFPQAPLLGVDTFLPPPTPLGGSPLIPQAPPSGGIGARCMAWRLGRSQRWFHWELTHVHDVSPQSAAGSAKGGNHVYRDLDGVTHVSCRPATCARACPLRLCGPCTPRPQSACARTAREVAGACAQPLPVSRRASSTQARTQASDVRCSTPMTASTHFSDEVRLATTSHMMLANPPAPSLPLSRSIPSQNNLYSGPFAADERLLFTNLTRSTTPKSALSRPSILKKQSASSLMNNAAPPS